MNAQSILESEDFKRCIAFHGHLCPGLSIGYKAAHTAMAWLQEKRSEDEEVVAIVETDACSADAIQVLTGCTFGKGNFIYRDYGKMVLTLLSRTSGQGVRVAVKPNALDLDEEHLTLIGRMMKGDATDDERKRFKVLHHKRTCAVLEIPTDELFNITAVEMQLPAKAKIERSEFCSRCGEPTMPAKMVEIEAGKVCRACL